MSIDVEALKALLGQKQQSNADLINSVNALGGIGTKQRLDEHARRMGAVQDAYWANKCPDYNPPSEDDIGTNYLNCTIQSDAAVKAITGALDDKPRKAKPWWRWLLGALLTMLAVALGALIVYYTAAYFQQTSDFDMIALPFDPNQ